MRCTQCSQVVKPVVALDIDGTLGDYHGHFERFAESWMGRIRDLPVEYDGTERYGEWFCRTYDTDLETFRAAKLAFRMGGLKRFMPVMPDADLLTRLLREDGIEVWLVTNRPYLKVDSIDPDTRFWLARNNIMYDHLLYGPRKYERLLDHIDKDRILAVVDDDMGQVQEALQLGLDAILVRSEYNRGCRYGHVAMSLYHVRTLLQLRLAVWNRLQDASGVEADREASATS